MFGSIGHVQGWLERDGGCITQCPNQTKWCAQINTNQHGPLGRCIKDFSPNCQAKKASQSFTNRLNAGVFFLSCWKTGPSKVWWDYYSRSKKQSVFFQLQRPPFWCYPLPQTYGSNPKETEGKNDSAGFDRLACSIFCAFDTIHIGSSKMITMCSVARTVAISHLCQDSLRKAWHRIIQVHVRFCLALLRCVTI